MADNWTEGYFTDLPYTFGYYREMSPAYLRFCMLLKGLTPPPEADFSYLELAMGNGFSANIHAAANKGAFSAMDFMPVHAAYAEKMAKSGHTGLAVSDESLEDFCRREHAMYDYVCIHGGWTWIDARNRDYIASFLRKCLKPGGVFFISYNCWPGSSTNAPLRELFTLFNEYYQPVGIAPEKRIRSSFALAEAFLQCGPLFLNSSPWFAERFESLKKESISYLAHEFFNSGWHVFWFRDVARQLAEAKLNYSASCRPCDNLPDFGLTPDALRFLKSVENVVAREELWDFFCNTQFRMDIFSKGAPPLPSGQRNRQLKEFKFILTKSPGSFEYAMDSGMGRYTLDVDAHASVARILASDKYAPKTLGQIGEQLSHKMDFNELIAIIARLMAKNYAQPCLAAIDVEAEERCGLLNRFIISGEGGNLRHLASPVTGGGIEIGEGEEESLARALCGGQGLENCEMDKERLSMLRAAGILSD